jgi:regulator of sigma E protease
MNRLLYIAPALVLVSFLPGAGFWGPVVLLVGLIFFHELGHFLVAKWMGLPVEVFSLGFGTRVVGFAWNETDVRLSILPLGGYVRLAGYNPEDPNAEDPHGFQSQPAWKRLAFYSGGILANVLITVIIFFFIGINNARTIAAHPQPSPLLVMDVLPGMPAAQAGIQPGDQIKSFGPLNFPGNSNEEVITFIRASVGKPIPVTLDREGTLRTFAVTPRGENGAGKVGVTFEPSNWTYDKRPFRAGDLWAGAAFSVGGSARLGWEIFANFGKLVSHKVSFKEVGGPITIVRAGSRAAKAGLLQFMGLIALISMNLAVLNALPIPFLDGGHAALLLFEKARGKDLSNLVKERILTGGFIFIVGLFALIMFQDIWKLRH